MQGARSRLAEDARESPRPWSTTRPFLFVSRVSFPGKFYRRISFLTSPNVILVSLPVLCSHSSIVLSPSLSLSPSFLPSTLPPSFPLLSLFFSYPPCHLDALPTRTPDPDTLLCSARVGCDFTGHMPNDVVRMLTTSSSHNLFFSSSFLPVLFHSHSSHLLALSRHYSALFPICYSFPHYIHSTHPQASSHFLRPSSLPSSLSLASHVYTPLLLHS